MIFCENCGYPVINGMHYCPNCSMEMPLDELGTVPVQSGSSENAYEAIPVCSLKPVSLPGEMEVPESIYEEGAEVILSRRNTVSQDMSIDGNAQACLFYADGYWFIEDRSSDNSTYVHAGAGIKLEPGDIIKMGNRKFMFNVKK